MDVDGGAGSKMKLLRQQAEQLIAGLPAVLHSSNVDSFCTDLLPTLLQPHQIDSTKLKQRYQHKEAPKLGDGAAGAASKDVTELQGVRQWNNASDVIDSKLITLLKDLGMHSKGFQHPLDPDSNMATCWWGEMNGGVEDLRLCTCKKCKRVITQVRFAAHWAECSKFNYNVSRPPPITQNLVNKSPVGGTTVKIKLPKSDSKKKRKLDVGTALVSEAVVPEFKEVEIEVITCDGCGISPITGKRFQCNQCDDFDLCDLCHDSGLPSDFHNPTHTFSEVAIPTQPVGIQPLQPLVGLEGDSKPPEREKSKPSNATSINGKADKSKQANQVIDLDRICGVPLETGCRCMRTIDCKAHTQAAKREVMGRSRQYDELLLERKAFKAKMQALQLEAAGGGPSMGLRAQRLVKEKGGGEDFGETVTGKRARSDSGTQESVGKKIKSESSAHDAAGASASSGKHSSSQEIYMKPSRDSIFPEAPPRPFIGVYSKHPIMVKHVEAEKAKVLEKKKALKAAAASKEAAASSGPEGKSEGAGASGSSPAGAVASGVLAGPVGGDAVEPAAKTKKKSNSKKKGVAAVANGAIVTLNTDGPAKTQPGVDTSTAAAALAAGRGKPKKQKKEAAAAAAAAAAVAAGATAVASVGVAGAAGRGVVNAKGVIATKAAEPIGVMGKPLTTPPPSVPSNQAKADALAKSTGRGVGRGVPAPAGHAPASGMARAPVPAAARPSVPGTSQDHGAAHPGAVQAGQGRGTEGAETRPPGSEDTGEQKPMLRVRQTHKWAFNLRRKTIDKSKVRGNFNIILPVGLDVHTAMVIRDEQGRVRLGTENDGPPCKPQAHRVEMREELIQVVFQRRQSRQQATVYVDAVCSFCKQCFFAAEMASTGPNLNPHQHPNAPNTTPQSAAPGGAMKPFAQGTNSVVPRPAQAAAAAPSPQGPAGKPSPQAQGAVSKASPQFVAGPTGGWASMVVSPPPNSDASRGFL